MSIGERLKEERDRLGFNQADFASLAAASRRSQIDWEKDVATPNAKNLAAIAKVGADIQYIVTGTRSAQALSQDEQELVGLWRAASLAGKAAAHAALTAGSTPPKSKTKQVVHGSVGQQAAGDVINQQGVNIEIGAKPGGRRKR